jgi:NAD(P)-dependent dehydrogenase (short-subunit alcohol dehydrogenase family)
MSHPVISLENKVAVITGASRGIGAAISRAFVASGACVMLAARKAEPLEALAHELRDAGGTAETRACHTGHKAELEKLFADTAQAFGHIDILVNNAATNPYFGPMVGIDDGAWAKTFEVNLKGYFDAACLLASHLTARGTPGAIINVASIAGLRAAPMQGVYGATKAAIISMTQTLAVELGPAHIRVNAIAPGLVRTRFAKVLVETPEISNRTIEKTPLGRIGEPEDIAAAAVYLASDAASFVTGHTLVIDGGVTVGGI